MDLWSTLLTIRRRWRIALPVLALAAVGSLLIILNLGVDYETRASAVLTPARSRVLNGVVQPRLVNKWEPRSLLPVVTRQLTNTNQRAALKSQGLSTHFVVTIDAQAPVVDLTVSAKTAARSKATAEALLRAIREATSSIQESDGVPTDELITAELVVLSNEPQRLTGVRTRVGFALGLLGLGATAIAAFAAEDVARRKASSSPDAPRVIDLVAPDAPDTPAVSAAAQTAESARRMRAATKPASGPRQRTPPRVP